MIHCDLFSNSYIGLINQKCHQLHPSLILTDSYFPKPIQKQDDYKLVFWSIVTNIYGLFYDCIPFLFRSHNQFKNIIYNNDSIRLLDTMVKYGSLSVSNRDKIINYSKALGELRSIFCHNKPPDTIDQRKINIGIASYHWNPYSNNSFNSYDYKSALDVFTNSTLEIMDILSTAIDSLTSSHNASVITEWQKALVGWYLQSNDVRYKSIKSLQKAFRKQFPSTVLVHQLLEIKRTNSEYQFRCGLTLSDLFNEVLNKLNAYSCRATPNQVWHIILDEILY